ncbi:hypothetical protein V6N13_049450 [Hibiscus sabdariffa]
MSHELKKHMATVDGKKIVLGFEVDDNGSGINPSKWKFMFKSSEQADPFMSTLVLFTLKMVATTGLGTKALRHVDILFRPIKERRTITWNTMLYGYTHMDKSEEASFLFQEMLVSGVESNHIMIASILPLCARVVNQQHDKEFHYYIHQHKVYEDCLLLSNALVAMYASVSTKKQKRNTTTVENCPRIFVSLDMPLKHENDEPLKVNVLFKHIHEMLSENSAIIVEFGADNVEFFMEL